MDAGDGEYRVAESLEDAMLDCARYNDGDDAQRLHDALVARPHLVIAQDQQGRTAMHLAAANGHTAIMHTLVEFGAAPDVPNHEGNTALHFAALNNQINAARLLLSWGWHASTKNLFGKTPLQLIYGKRFEEMEALLLDHDDEIDIYVEATTCSVGEAIAADETPPEEGMKEALYSNCECRGNSNKGNSIGSDSACSAFCIGSAEPPSGKVMSPPGAVVAITDSSPKHIDPTALLGSSEVDGVE